MGFFELVLELIKEAKNHVVNEIQDVGNEFKEYCEKYSLYSDTELKSEYNKLKNSVRTDREFCARKAALKKVLQNRGIIS